MMSRRTKYLAAGFAAVAMIATAAGARTLDPHTATGAPPAKQTQTTQPSPATTGSASVDTPLQAAPMQLHGITACNVAGPGLDCGKLEMLLAK